MSIDAVEDAGKGGDVDGEFVVRSGVSKLPLREAESDATRKLRRAELASRLIRLLLREACLTSGFIEVPLSKVLRHFIHPRSKHCRPHRTRIQAEDRHNEAIAKSALDTARLDERRSRGAAICGFFYCCAWSWEPRT